MARAPAVVVALLALAAGIAAAAAAAPPVASGGAVLAYPSSRTVTGRGLPDGGARELHLAAGRGEREGAWLVAKGGGPIQAKVDAGSLGPLGLELAWGHFVQVGDSAVPDALLPWSGDPRPAERPAQPLYVRVVVPRTAAPGTYRATVSVTVGVTTTAVPIDVRVFPFAQPAPGEGSLLTSFHVSPTTYVNTVARVYGLGSTAQRRAANAALFRFLAAYGISPSSWGFGEPRSASGYASSPKWWLDSATNMRDAVGAGPFAAMRIPISSNRTGSGHWIAGLSPSEPERWCDYLRSVRGFWAENGWLTHSVPLLYAQDEPGPSGQRLVARQSKTLHQCWPGARSMMTGTPSPTGANRFLYDGRDGDDLDVWVVLSRRYYGSYTVPAQQSSGNRARELFSSIERIRKRASIWSYTYDGVGGTPGFRADEPLSDPRMLLLWNALEGLQGLLYGQGVTSYDRGNPLDGISRHGEFALAYPGPNGPIPSARLEQIRDGIEDWALFQAVRRAHGAGRVRSILGDAGLFSADPRGVHLACRLGCELKSGTKYSWPHWSRDASTAARIERARLAAFRSVG
jgi:hypothetical protein